MKSHVFVAALLMASVANAQQAVTPVADKSDTLWVSISAVLVLLMTPALALFYGGLVRRKNVLNTMMHSFILMGVGTLIWILAGYSLAFGKSNGLIGGTTFLLGNGISMTQPLAGQTVPAGAFMLFQMMFAIITPALISGAIAERMKFSGYVLFTALWSILVYAPVACWVWNPDGWLLKLGAIDFAGGTVVHLASGAAALACVLALGKRSHDTTIPHNTPMVLFGAGLLWVGWIGFNAGSALAINDTALGAFVATQVAAAAGLVGWCVAEGVRHGKPSAVGAASGLVAGLVGITPAAGYVSPGAAILIGLIAGAGCFFATGLKSRFKFDDALDVVGVHGVGGILGALLTGVFASVTVNPGIKDNLSQGRLHLVLVQAAAVGAVLAFSFTVSFLLMKLTTAIVGVRSGLDDEALGLDESYHGELGYRMELGVEEIIGDKPAVDSDLALAGQ